MTAFIDTNVLIRHLTGDPPDLAARATAFLGGAEELLLADVIVAETVYALESFYEVPVEEVARLVRSVIAFDPIEVMNTPLLLRSREVYETHGIDCAEAYLVASDLRKRQDRVFRPDHGSGTNGHQDRAIGDPGDAVRGTS